MRTSACAAIATRSRAIRGTRETILQGDFSEASGYRAGLDICARDEKPDAIFAANDMMALGCLFALTEHGLRVPDDIALAGFDDIPIARFVTPPLTTVRVRIADLGRRAFERLVALIDKEGGVRAFHRPAAVRARYPPILRRARARRRPRRQRHELKQLLLE